MKECMGIYHFATAGLGELLAEEEDEQKKHYRAQKLKELAEFEEKVDDDDEFKGLELKDLLVSVPVRTIFDDLAESNNQRQVDFLFNALQDNMEKYEFLQLVNMTDVRGNSPLHSATLSDNELLINLLLSVKDINVNVHNSKGETPLYLAAVHDRGAILESLIKDGADLCARTNKGETPLIGSLRYGGETIKILLDSKGIESCINIQDSKGNTALHYVVESMPFIEVISMFLKKEADIIEVKNNNGQSPLDIAQIALSKATDLKEIKARKALLDWLNKQSRD